MNILMVCLGNICRSPLAQGIMEKKIKKYNLNNTYVDSAGTADYHVGEKPDPRTIEIAGKHGIDITKQRGRQFKAHDFRKFDKIYVMDHSNLSDVSAQAENDDDLKKVDLLLNSISPGENRAVPDPYYGGKNGFENVYQLLDAACEKIVTSLKQKQ